ncbi:gustatory receptor for bitter taste 22e [Musca vetustissima]|uniref:gustatory receptor for bitter taste 22e n=1 Tax=Musca vetustissima TaxID=27455 RepID=UPI002AB64A6E|nr:gustatory receptor for bitter taste 22e [Musca vetustissima]
MGLTSYWYNEDKGIYQRSIASCTVVISVNILASIVLIEVLIDYSEIYENVEERHRLMVIMSSFKYLQGVLLLNTVWHLLRQDKKYTDLKWHIERLEEQSRKHFSKSQDIEKKFKFLAYLKYSIMLYLYGSVLITSYTLMSPQRNLWMWVILKTFLHTNQQYLTYLILYQYFQLFWKSNRMYAYIERQVGLLANEASDELPSLIRVKLSWLMELHSKFGSDLRDLELLFKSAIFQCRYNINLYNIIAVYYVYLFSVYIKDAVAFLGLVVATYFCNHLDLYLNDNMTDITKQHFENLNINLRLFNGVRNSAAKLNRECEEFAIYLCNRKLNLKLSGALNMDRKSWFNMMSRLVMYSIILIQSHINIDRHK